MRRRIVAGNWKMYKNHTEGASLASEILAGLEGKSPDCEIVLIPPFTTLPAVAGVALGTILLTGGQNLYFEAEGAFTGEISPAMLASLGCSYVLVGHSERRHVMGETGELLARKLRAALTVSLAPIYCVGEVLEEREAGKAAEVVAAQLRDVIAGLTPGEMANVVVAYEPVWAIGTGRTATRQDASEMHASIRATLETIFNEEIAKETTILYGGSVKPKNAADLLGDPQIDGVLVGGASLAADSFLGIVFPS